MAALNSVEPFVFELTNVDIFAQGEQWAALRRPSLIEAIEKRLERLAAVLDGREWLAGTFSIADIAMATVLRAGDRDDILGRQPPLAAYLERATARPAFKAALADQLAAFAAEPAQGEPA